MSEGADKARARYLDLIQHFEACVQEYQKLVDADLHTGEDAMAMAEQRKALIAELDALLPLNPVYEKTRLIGDLNRLRDGTWLPNQASDATGGREWLAYHYPEHVEDYDRAVRIFHTERG